MRKDSTLTRLICALLVSVLALGGCQLLPTASSQSSGLAGILERGELRVGISGDLPPLNMKNRAGEIIGLEVDLVSALANAMGLAVQLVETPFADLIPSLERGEIDLVISGMTMTPRRNARIAFVGPYFISGTSVLTKSEEIAREQEPRNLDGPNRRYVALEGSTSIEFVEEVFSQSELVTTSDYETGVQMVIAGEVDGLVADFHVCMHSTWLHPGAGLMAVRTPFTVEPLGIGLSPTAPLLLNLVTNYLGTLEDTGLLGQLKAKWLSDGAWLAELP
jgi:polar amino acid transport system substrate-binding protein